MVLACSLSHPIFLSAPLSPRSKKKKKTIAAFRGGWRPTAHQSLGMWLQKSYLKHGPPESQARRVHGLGEWKKGREASKAAPLAGVEDPRVCLPAANH